MHQESLLRCNNTASTTTYSLSLHDALPIYAARRRPSPGPRPHRGDRPRADAGELRIGAALPPRPCRTDSEFSRVDRKSTRLNSSHVSISYAVFCLTNKMIYTYEVQVI